jgi:hypothetical protein
MCVKSIDLLTTLQARLRNRKKEGDMKQRTNGTGYDLLVAIRAALALVDCQRGLMRRYGSAQLPQQTRLAARRNLAQEMLGPLDEFDFDVLQDLMGLLEKLKKGVGRSDKDFDKRIRLALEMLPSTLDKDRPAHPDHVVWMFNQIYKQLAWVDANHSGAM